MEKQPYCTVSPEMAPVGQTHLAYLQRLVAIVLGIICIAINWNNFSRDCRLFRIVEKDVDANISAISIVTESMLKIFNQDYNRTGDDGMLDDYEIDFGEYEAFYFGFKGFAPVDYDNKGFWWYNYECIEYAEVDVEYTEAELDFRNTIWLLIVLTLVFAFLGLFCATVELICCVFYPSVIAAAFFFSLAAIMEGTWLAIAVFGFETCILAQRCYVGHNFWTYLFSIGGYGFSSCLLVLGLRTYPVLLWRNRDPKHCRVVEAEIVSDEELIGAPPNDGGDQLRWQAVRDDKDDNENGENYGNEKENDGGNDNDNDNSDCNNCDASNDSDEHYGPKSGDERTGVPTKAYNKLHETHRMLRRSEQKCKEALERAERAEGLLEAYASTRNHNSYNNNDDEALTTTSFTVSNEDEPPSLELVESVESREVTTEEPSGSGYPRTGIETERGGPGGIATTMFGIVLNDGSESFLYRHKT